MKTSRFKSKRSRRLCAGPNGAIQAVQVVETRGKLEYILFVNNFRTVCYLARIIMIMTVGDSTATPDNSIVRRVGSGPSNARGCVACQAHPAAIDLPRKLDSLCCSSTEQGPHKQFTLTAVAVLFLRKRFPKVPSMVCRIDRIGCSRS